MSPNRLTIEAWRGECLESSHEVDAIAVNENGETVLEVGHYDRQITWRSAAKPFQLQVALSSVPYQLRPSLNSPIEKSPWVLPAIPLSPLI